MFFKKITLLFVFVFVAGNMFAQKPATVNHQAELQAIAPGFTSNDPKFNPRPEQFTSKIKALEVLSKKGDAMWAAHKQQPNMDNLINSYKAFKVGVQIIEQLKEEGISNTDRKILEVNYAWIYEGAIRASIEGYNLSSNERLINELFAVMEASKTPQLYHLLNNTVPSDGTSFLKQTLELKACQEAFSNPRQAIVEYYVGKENIYGLVIWPEGYKPFILGGYEGIKTSIKQFKNSISTLPDSSATAQNFSDYTTSAHYLYQSILNHPLSSIPKDINSLVIVPHGVLSEIPFDLLLMEESGLIEPTFVDDQLAYVMNAYQLDYALSASDYIQNRSGESDLEKIASDLKVRCDQKKANILDPAKPHPSQWKGLMPPVMKPGKKKTGSSGEGGSKLPFILVAVGVLVGLLFIILKKRSAA